MPDERGAFSPIWHRSKTGHACCPVCEREGEFPLLLDIDSLFPPYPQISFATCPACKTVFQLDFKSPDYTLQSSAGTVTKPSIVTKFYVEQGAGLDTLVLPAFIASRRPGRRYMEIGCGFGFGLDFAHRALGFEVRGVDPSPIAREGANLLGIDIASRYLTHEDAERGGPSDAIAAVEVIEHIESPYDFLAILKANLAADGILILTTPDAGYIEFAVDKPGLLPVLTPGYHALLYTEESLALALRKAGFSDIQIKVRGATLFAIAGPGASTIDIDGVFDPEIYRTYLENRLTSFKKRSLLEAGLSYLPFGHRVKPTMLEVGFSYRLFKHHVNRGNYSEAKPVLRRLARILRARDGIDILDVHGLLTRVTARPWSFEDFVAGLPTCLASLMFFTAMLRLNHDGDRAGALAYFYATHVVAGIFREAMKTFGIDDGETADLERVAREHIKLVLGWMSS